jgi:preprotein translocase subunit YajC
MSIGNLSSAPDQAGLRSERDALHGLDDFDGLDDLMDLHLSVPDGLGLDAATLVVDHRAPERTELVAQSDSDDDGGGAASTIVGLLPLLLIVVAVYFLLLRPRQRQMRQQRELQSSLEVGDEVMLTSGVYGFITGFEQGSDVVWVEIDDDVQIRVSRAAISGKVVTPGAAAPGATTGEGAAAIEPAASAPRRPTLKGGGAKPAADAPAAGAADTTDEPADG